MKKLNKKVLSSLLALGCISPVMAETVTGNSTVTVGVIASCKLTVENLIFPEWTVLETNNYALGNFGVNCSKGMAFKLKVNAGNGDAATITNRSMKSLSGDSLKYSLIVDSKNWGDTPGSMIEDIGVGAMRNNTIVGVMPGGQYVTPGAYSDTLTVTLEY